jgi:hypothetical protein
MGMRSVKIPWTTTVPRWRVEARQSLSEASTPTASTETSTPRPSVSSLILCGILTSRGLKTSVAPSSRARSRLVFETSVR